MKRRVLLIAVLTALVVVSCSEGKVEKAVSQQSIEKVARIAAMLESDEAQALEMMTAEKMTVDQYKEIMTAIALDEKLTNTFVQAKKTFMEQYK
ncbi:hypothetical protein IBX73_07785 [candidate division WOR-3 bacterium]|nr:hypothetical protein [candidate division WOR-3 bacterium]